MTNEQLDAVDIAISHIEKAINILIEDADMEFHDESVVSLFNVQADLDDLLENHEPA